MYYKSSPERHPYPGMPETGDIVFSAEPEPAEPTPRGAEVVTDGGVKATLLGEDTLVLPTESEWLPVEGSLPNQIAEVSYGDSSDRSDINKIRVFDVSSCHRSPTDVEGRETVYLDDGSSINLPVGTKFFIEMEQKPADDNPDEHPKSAVMGIGDGATMFGKSSNGKLGRFEGMLSETSTESDIVFSVDAVTGALSIACANPEKSVLVTTAESTGETMTPDEFRATKTGAAIIEATFPEPEVEPQVPVPAKSVARVAAEKLASSKLSERLNTRADAKSEKRDRKELAEKQKQAIQNRVQEAKSELRIAKDTRNSVRSRTSFVNRYLDKSQLRGEIVREANKLETGKSFQIVRRAKNTVKSFKAARNIINTKAEADRQKADDKVAELKQIVLDAKNRKRKLRSSTYGGSSVSYSTVRSELVSSRGFDSLSEEDKKTHYEARRKALMAKRNSEQSIKQAEARRRMVKDARAAGRLHVGRRV